MKEIIWECKAKVIWEHILYTFYFQNVKTESWDGAGWVEGWWGMIFFSSASQVELNSFSDFYSWISSKFLSAGSLHDTPKGKPRSFFAKMCPSWERWCTLSVTTSSPTQKLTGLSFLLQEDLSFFLESGTACSSQLPFIHAGLWGRTSLVNKVVMHYRRRRLTLKYIWISKVSALMSWASWSYGAESSATIFSCPAACSQPSQGGDKSENSHHHHHQEKK